MLLLKKLKRSFFNHHPKEVAPRLLGKYIVSKIGGKEIVAEIVETECYGGEEDLGCHVGRFGRTKKTEPLFGEIGHAYIYPVHINTYCLNVVSHKKGEAGGVLIRALEPIKGIDIILKNLGRSSENFDRRKLLNGPGKVCKALKIDKSLNGIDLVEGDKLYFTEGEKVKKEKIVATPRINIPYAGECKDWLWRFIIKDNEEKRKII